MRAVKRERYGKKELDRLKKTLGIEESQPSTSEVNMEDVSELVTVVTSKEIKNKKRDQQEDADIMEVNEINDMKKFNPKTLRNENGAYPIWLHPRKIKRASKAKKKTNRKGKVTKRSKKGKVSKKTD